jgi:hypothetical protein
MQTVQFSFTNKNWSQKLPQEFDSKDTLLLVYFPTTMVQEQCWAELSSAFSHSIIVGCSGSGEIKQNEILDDEIIVTLIKFQNTQLQISTLTDINNQDSQIIGKQLAQKFPQENLKGIFIHSDGLAINGSSLIKGIVEILGEKISISGGLAGDGSDFKVTYVLINGRPMTNAISAVGFYGDSITISASAFGGWVPFGPVRKITKSTNNILYELDGSPALALYKNFLGEQAKKLPSSALLFPMYLKSDGEERHRDAIRTILAVDEDKQSMTFAGDVPQGSQTQLMRASHDNLVEAAKMVAKANVSKIDPLLPSVSLIVSCVGRRLVLGEKTESEIEGVLQFLPSNSLQTGFYSYGEIAPSNKGECDLHNQTLTLTIIQEKVK